VHGFFSASDGCRLHYHRLGDTGSWVVLIHGFTDNAERMWLTSGIAAALAERHRVLAFDTRNHGRSDKPEPNGTGRWQDAVELMDAMSIDTAHVHGYSMGGGIVLRLLAAVPERLLTASFGGAGMPESDPDLAAQAESLDAPAPEPSGVDAAAFRLLRRRSAARRTDGAAPRPVPLELDLSRVAIPVMAINGEYDRPHARTHRLWRELRDFHNVVLPGLNHMSAVGVGSEMPPAYGRALVRFVSANDGGVQAAAAR
jgi:pimeloyl-ACP methyl ester carboxylesterase